MAPSAQAATASLAKFYARNGSADLSHAKLLDPAQLDSLSWEAGERDRLVAPLRVMARLTPRPQHAAALVDAKLASAHHVARLPPVDFVASMRGKIDAGAARAIHDRARGVRSRVLQRWMQLREAASPYRRVLSARERRANFVASTGTAVAPGVLVNYKSIFGEAADSDIPHDASIIGPGAYAADLMRTIERAITAQSPGLPGSPLDLSSRRPDLQNLLLTPANATDEIPTVELILEVLESSLEAFARTRTTMTKPAYPDHQPPAVQVVNAWPSSVQGGTLYTVVDPVAGGTLTTAGSTLLTGTVSIRSGPSLQSVTAAAPIAVGGGDTSVVIEGFAFTLASANTTPIVQFNGGSLVLRNCIFASPANTTLLGWAIKCPSGASGSILIENCTFIDTTNPSVAAIDAIQSGALTLSVSDSIFWPDPNAKTTYAFIECNSTNAVNIAYCDIKGGKASISGPDGHTPQRVNYADTNFDEDPGFAPSTPLNSAFNPTSPCIGRGSQGHNVGASFDIYDTLAWAVYPPDLPFDRQFATAQMALAALDTNLAQVDRALAPLANGQNVYFPLSRLGISLADYQVLTTKMTDAACLAPYFGLPKDKTSFAEAAVVLAPSASAFAATDVATWLGLTPGGLRGLVYEDLAAAEIAQGIQSGNLPQVSGWNGFFVNGQGDAACNTLALVTQYVPVGRYALTFGTADNTSINNSALTPALSLDAFTIGLWMYQPGPSPAATILTVGSAIEWQITGFTLTLTISGTHQVTVDLSAFATDPQWIHLATTYDPLTATFSVYVNGAPAASLPPLPDPGSGWVSGTVTLGADQNGFSGLLCELTVWEVASTAEQITTWFQSQPMTAPTTNVPNHLKLYLPVNDGPGTTTVIEWVTGSPLTITGTSSWIPVGLPAQAAAATPGTSAVEDGVIFAQTELLVGRGTNPGVTIGNLDRINRFTRLARRTGWSFAELDWALFTLFLVQNPNSPPTDFAGTTAPQLFADLARLSDATGRMNIGVREACALFGPLKPFGRGRLGDQVALFDQVFNRPPLSGAAFAPDMSLSLSVATDFEKPGPIARRLAFLLSLDVGQLTSLVRWLAGDENDENDAFTLNGTSLTALYRCRLLAGWLGLDIDSFLDLISLTALPAQDATCAPSAFAAFLRTADWIGQAGLKPPDLRYLITPPGQLASPADAYQKKVELEITQKLPRLKTDLAQAASPWLVGPDSFIAPNTTEPQSLAIYNDAKTRGYIDASGIITKALWARLPQAPYRVPSDAYKTIGDAVTAAVAALNAGVPAATVLIAPGTYDQAGNFGLAIALGKGVLTLQAQGDFSTTIIDCNHDGHQPPGNFLSVSAPGGNAGSVVINGLTIKNGNVPASGGGAIYSECPLEITNCILRGNTAQNGGAVYMAGSSPQLTFKAANCVLYGNSASSNGGALYLNNAVAKLLFCTAYGNSSGDGTSNGVYGSNVTLTVAQSILWNLTPNFPDHDDWNGIASPTFLYSDVHQTSWTTPYPSGCVSADPQLLDPEHGNYELTPPEPGKEITPPEPGKPGSSGSPCWGTAQDGGNMGFGGATQADLTALALYPFAYAQIAALQKALSRFFNNDVLPFDVVLGALGPYQNGLEILLSDTTDTPAAAAYVREVYRYLLLANLFGLDGRTLSLIFSDPALLSLAATGTPPVPTLPDLELLARFARLRTQSPDATDGLISYLRGTGGTGATGGTATLATLFGWNAGDIAALLDAARIADVLTATSGQSPAYATATFSGTPPASAFTVEAWVSTGKIGVRNCLLGVRLGSNWSFAAQVDGNSCIAFQVWDKSNPQNSTTVTATAPIEANIWHHVAGVFDGTATLTLYVDGQQAAQSATAVAPAIASGSQIDLGQDDTVTDGSANGIANSLAEVRLWNVARSPAQILANMRRRIPAVDSDFSNLFGYWTFENANAFVDLTGYWSNPVLNSVSFGATPPPPLAPVPLATTIIAAADAMALAQRTGLDARALLSLYRNGLVAGADGAAPLREIAAADDDKAAAVRAAMADLRRNALKAFAIPQINAQTNGAGFPVVTDNDLSDYLLLDVDMGVETSTSRIVQATLSLQQYIQRCRLGLEPGAAKPDLTDREWEWIRSYRMWEANRKVFLYPETYLRPELRNNKTPLFAEFEQGLSNSVMTKDGLERLYRRYLDHFAVVASLQTVGSWFEPGRAIDSVMTATSGAQPAYVTATCNSTSQPYSAMTVEAWVRINTAKPAQPNLLLGTYPAGTPTTPTLGFQVDPAGILSFMVGAPAIVQTIEPLQADTWYHVAAVFDSGAQSVSLFIDGMSAGEKTSQTIGSVAFSANDTVNLGQDTTPAAHEGCVNALAEVRIWNLARTQAQIQADMRRRIPSADPDFAGLVGYWTFEGGSIVDLTGTWRTPSIPNKDGISFGPMTPVLDPHAQPDLYYFIGKTRTQPPTFYCRTMEMRTGQTPLWNAWEKIELSINANYATPVVSQGRLYLFWVEFQEIQANANPPPGINHHYRATIKYSMRNADGSWLAAQSPFPAIELPGDASDNFLDPYSSSIWQKPIAFPTVNNDAPAIAVIYGTTTYCGVVNWDQTTLINWDAKGNISSPVLPGNSNYQVLTTGVSQGAGLQWEIGQSVLTAVGLRPVAPAGILGCDGTGQLWYWRPETGLSLSPWSKANNLNGNSSAITLYQNSLFAAVPEIGSKAIGLYQNSAPLSAVPWTQMNANIAAASVDNSGLVIPPSLICANGNLYCAFTDGSKTYCASQKLGNLGQAWTQSEIPVPIFEFALTADQLGTIYCLSATADTGAQYCSASSNNAWSTPAPLQGLPSLYTVSNAIFWNGAWYLAGYNSSEIVIYTAQSITGTWSAVETIPPIPPIPNETLSYPFLAVIGERLCCIYVMLVNQFTNFYIYDPNLRAWQILIFEGTSPYVANVVAYPFFSAQVLTSLPDGAATAPVINQLGAGTVSIAGADFLVQALDPTTGGVMNGQLGVTVTAGNPFNLSLSAPLPPPDVANASFRLRRLTSSAVQTLSRELATGGIDALLSQAAQGAAEFSIADKLCPGTTGPDQDTISFSLSDAYGMYYREIFFFIPWLIAERLQGNGQFADARTYLEYIFKPSAAANDVAPDDKDYWQCLWLRDAQTTGTLDALEDLDPAALAAYHDDPFDATAIADLRPRAYQRAIVTAYIQNLIAWGDSLFTANTRETINEADQLYRYARDILGPRPRRKPYAPPAPQTYAELAGERENEFLMVLESLDAQSGADAPAPPREGEDPSDGVMDDGFYFGVPDNPEFLANWNTIDDRLHKIRHGLDITGKVDDLALFDPPLSVADIQRLGRSGGSAVAASGDAERLLLLENQFLNMLNSARSLAGSVIDYGRSLLQALEQKDADGLYQLQSSQQSALADRMRQIRTDDVNSANATLASLQATLSSATYRRDYYKGLLAAGVSASERMAIELTGVSLTYRGLSSTFNAISAPLWWIPNIYGLADGGDSPGAAMQSTAQTFGDLSGIASESAGLANTIASYDRRAQDWQFQQKLAEMDVDQLNKQIAAAQAQASSLQKQFDLEQASFEQAQAVQQYYVNKFSNGQLYAWMADTLAALYQQLYQIALSSAQTLQATLSTITGIDQQFVNASGWNAGWRGLLAGESLLVDLARMEQAFNQWHSAHPADTTGHETLLSQLAPEAFHALVTTGKCVFDLDHAFFDRHFPGHYLRTLSGLSVQLPGVSAQRYDTHMVITRLSHVTLRHPEVAAARFLLGQPGANPGKALHRALQPRRAALSHARFVDGREQGEFHSGVIHAFDGGGAVSRWQLELPPGQNRIDLGAIRDVVLTVHYQARYGGDAFRRDVEAALPPLRPSVLIDVARDFAEQWNGRPGAGDWQLALPVARTLLPRNLPGRAFRTARIAVAAVPEDGADLADATLSLGLPGASAPHRLTLPSSEPVPRLLSAEPAPAERLWSEPWTLAFAENGGAARVKNVHLFVDFDEIEGA